MKLSVKLGVVGHILIPTLPRLRQHGEFGANSSGLARTGMDRGWGRKEKQTPQNNSLKSFCPKKEDV